MLLRIWYYGFGQPAIGDERVGSDANSPRRSDQTGTPVAEAVAVQHQWHPGIGEHHIRTYQISGACVVDVQSEDHRRGLRTLIDQLVAKTYLHNPISTKDATIQLAKDGPTRALDPLSDQGVARAFKHPRQSFSPLILAGFRGDEILAEFDQDM